MSAERLIEKLCPVVLRGRAGAREVLVFRHPQAGIQLVKGTREADEPFVDGALRELAEESGIDVGVAGIFAASSSDIAEGQLWHFVQVSAADLPEIWSFDTKDDGGHRFDFFWWPLWAEPDGNWHPMFGRVLALVRDLDRPRPVEPAVLMARYAEIVNQHHFDAVAPLIANDAVFWFGDGSHRGHFAIRAAFEATWAALEDELYWLEQVEWIAEGDAAASCVYTFHWQALVQGERRSGSGRGTSVFARSAQGWVIVHEHLSPPVGT